MTSDTPFPPGFLIGAGGVTYSFSDDVFPWLLANAGRLSRQAGPEHNYGLGPVPDWELIAADANDPNAYIPNDDHLYRFGKDYRLGREEAGLNAVRIHVSWARIEPLQGWVNQVELWRAKHMVQTARELGLEPVVVLLHFALPQWAAERGGLADRRIAADFARFAGQMAAALPDVRFWLTINEPEFYALQAYITRTLPPARWSVRKYLKANRHLIRMHRQAYAAVKQVQPGAQISAANSSVYFDPGGGRWGRWNRRVTRAADWWYNRRWRDSTIDRQDFVTCQFYFCIPVNGWPFRTGKHSPAFSGPRSDYGWPLHPDKLYDVVMDLHRRYGKPVMVTEFGLADKTDRRRGWYLTEGLTALLRATEQGADVLGLFVWSLTDVSEGHNGEAFRTGLIGIDWDTGQRQMRPSAHVLRSFIQSKTH
ncbi:family 1 glycosylhydrolase [Candidatus Parcubacteria bacterium]|nr:family 1 glycosylhydrolase [Candidatus Parcubacteria bacterium]